MRREKKKDEEHGLVRRLRIMGKASKRNKGHDKTFCWDSCGYRWMVWVRGDVCIFDAT